MDDDFQANVSGHQSDDARRRRLRWRARRGLLENDLLLTRFLDRYEHLLSDEEVEVLDGLLDLTDNDLLQVILGVQGPGQPLNSQVGRGLISRLRER